MRTIRLRSCGLRRRQCAGQARTCWYGVTVTARTVLTGRPAAWAGTTSSPPPMASSQVKNQGTSDTWKSSKSGKCRGKI